MPEMTSQDAQSQEVITAENTDESAAIEGDDVSGSEAENTEITATGVVTYIGTDIHGLPSFRLSDSADGNCYVHACLASSGGYGNIKVGDEITVKGTSIYSVMNT